MNNMKGLKENAISVRLETSQKERLQAVAEDLGVKPANLIRLAVNMYLDKIEAEEQVVIPLKKKASEEN